LRTLSHKSALDRGFALIRDAQGRMIRNVADAQAAGRLELEFADGRIEADVDGAAQPPARQRQKPRASVEPVAAPAQKKEKQGQLF
jgi:exodeoxyribonuclease VII large subunit